MLRGIIIKRNQVTFQKYKYDKWIKHYKWIKTQSKQNQNEVPIHLPESQAMADMWHRLIIMIVLIIFSYGLGLF